jgi:hypothetical protein
VTVAGSLEPLACQRLKLAHILGDCRVNAFFAPLGTAKINHIADCMVTQVSELFACPGFKYAGSEDKKGVACAEMKSARAKLGISDGDFSALVDDMTSGLMSAGVSSSDIAAAAPALADMKPDIVMSSSTKPTREACSGDGGAANDSGTTHDGG